ncbi:uncharacterized protein LOC109726414 isoform X1 [Ananas comosus]|uniref:Uncharacterized protein LOC109726414 isoform X1 n=1 Tax=Ananas comosus TaxID=4615 RepID=A0A6P5GUS2_ANACO|nr:uncharacterized protein LOC109726414 isoform X1 [Ananas comosus]
MSAAAVAAAAPEMFPRRHHSRRSTTSLLLLLRPLRGATPPLSAASASLFRRGSRDPRRSPRPLRNRGREAEPPHGLDGAAAALGRLRRRSAAEIRRFIDEGAEAYRDLRSAVRVERGNRVVFSCRRSSLVFVSNLLLWSFAAVLAARVLAWLGLGFRSRWGFGDWAVVRRDRSLGGREVVVGKRYRRRDAERWNSRVSVNPLSPVKGSEAKFPEISIGRRASRREELPKWWPEKVSSSPTITVGEEFQREANRLVRAIMDNRMSGKDFKYDDMIQLRQLCKVSGVKVSFGTENVRDSFYRTAVDFVLDACSRAVQPIDKIQINGEEPRIFISGLAHDIGLQNTRAATLIRAAVAARTRACFLQCWALEVQGKRFEALDELRKICSIHQIFPPEEQSPEMEMVASGLKRNLREDQREHLFSLYRGVCDAGNFMTAEEALGLRLER